jgi:hypothetical protein
VRLPLAVATQRAGAVAVVVQQGHQATHADFVIGREAKRAPRHHGRGLAISSLFLDP